MNCLKTILFVLFVTLFSSITLYSAGIIFRAKRTTIITIFLDNGAEHTITVSPKRPVKFNAVFAGFKKLRWIGEKQHIFEVNLRIKGHKGWYNVFIDNAVLTYQHKESLPGAVFVVHGQVIGKIEESVASDSDNNFFL